MFLRAHAAKRLPRHSLSCAPQYRPSARRPKQPPPRFLSRGPVRSAAIVSRRSGTGLWTAAIVVGIAIGGALLVPLAQQASAHAAEGAPSLTFDVAHLTDSHLTMPPNMPPGRPGTLTPDEEEKLRQLWSMATKVFGVQAAAEDVSDAGTPAVAPASIASEQEEKKEKKKSRLSVFKRSKGDKGTDADSTPSSARTSTDIHSISISADDDKFGQNQEFKAALANISPEDLRRAFWSMVKHDHPDALLLRFLRARKWHVEKALVMLISTMQWRLKEAHVDDDIMLNGELQAVAQATSSDPKIKKNAQDFLAQLRMGKSYLHGLDNEGRPMCFVRARLHKAGEQTEESLEKFTVFTIETARMILRPPIDTATVVFDLTDFSMANMDYTPVKFMIKCFEANYPESLGTVLVYKAPWVFNAVWSIVRGWLDPVVASKVHFAKNVEELQKYVPRSQIPLDCGGDEKWAYAYPEPVAGENDCMKDESTKQQLLQQQKAIVERYETTLLDWIQNGRNDQGADERRRERNVIAEELRQNYWRLDPYVRARSLYDRMGILGEAGKLEFYPQAKKESARPEVHTSADDLD